METEKSCVNTHSSCHETKLVLDPDWSAMHAGQSSPNSKLAEWPKINIEPATINSKMW